MAEILSSEIIDTLLEDFIKAGLLQFGYWLDTPDQAEGSPIRFNFDLLPAYPGLLDRTGSIMAVHPALRNVQRLVCDQDSLAAAVCVCLQTGIPLVYTRQTSAGSYQLVGAYDVGHPTVLIGDLYRPETRTKTDALKTHAARVGLNIISELYIMGLAENVPAGAADDAAIHCLTWIDAALIRRWVSQRWITQPQGSAIQRWMQQVKIQTDR